MSRSSQVQHLMACHRSSSTPMDHGAPGTADLDRREARGYRACHTLSVASAPGDEYELVVRGIVSQLAKRAGVDTTRLEHDVDVVGRATTNQIDVLWDLTDALGKPRRVVSKPATTRIPSSREASTHFVRSSTTSSRKTVPSTGSWSRLLASRAAPSASPIPTACSSLAPPTQTG